MGNWNRITLLSAAALMVGVVFLPLSGSADDRDEDAGKALYERWCTPCHSEDPHAPGTQRLMKRSPDVEPVLNRRPGLSAEFVRVFVRGGAGVMPSFRRTEISEDELDQLIAYLTSIGAADSDQQPQIVEVQD